MFGEKCLIRGRPGVNFPEMERTKPDPKDHQDGHYSIVGSKIIRPNAVYRVAVSTFGVKSAVAFRVSIAAAETVVASEELTLGANESRSIAFQIGDIPEAAYQLVAEGLSGLVFTSKEEIDYDSRCGSVLIQTDKSVYKPGDTVHFRVLVFDRYTEPLPSDTDMTVHICDGKGNRVKQWNSASLGECGVFEADLTLSTEPVLGAWSINVGVLGMKQSRSFDVDEYVLPTFEVTVNSPGNTFLDDAVMSVVVNSKYTYGKPVVGELTVSVRHSSAMYFRREPTVKPLCQTVAPIDGKRTVEFNLKEILKSSQYIREVEIEAEVCETLTGRTQKGSTTVQLHEDRYKVRLIEETSYFPGLPYNAWVKVSNLDDSPVRDDGSNEVVIQLRNFNTALFTETATLNDEGMAKLNANLHELSFDYLNVEVSFRGKSYHVQGIVNPRTEQEALLRVSPADKEPVPDKELKFDVACTSPMQVVAYALVSRGELIVAGAVDGSGSSTVSFTVPSSYRMVPRAKLLLHYISSTGYIVTAHAEVSFKKVFANQVNISLSGDELKPGETIDINVRAEKGSFVGLLAVDQSVLLLKSGNDICRDEVVQALEQYETAERHSYNWNRDRLSDCETAGVLLLSNRFIPQTIYPEAQLFGCGGNMARAMAFGAPAMAMRSSPMMCKMAMESAVVEAEEPSIRSNFPETWLWKSISNTVGTERITEIVPDTITSWIITCFAMSRTHGLGLVDAPSKVNVFMPFFLSLDLPYSVKLGETVRIPVIVFNYMDEDQLADIVFFNNDAEFEFLSDDSMDVYDKKHRQVKSQVARNGGKTFTFKIKPTKVGHITLKLTAKCALAGDGIERQLLVEPEGLPQYINKALLIDLRSVEAVREELKVAIPEDAVPDSTKVEVSVIGDVLGASIENLESLIRMPFGCGEQNMLNFVPCIAVLDYLTACRRLTGEIERKAKKCMEVGYQRELTYRHEDGSFSAFGESDKSGSTWLTAFVAKSFLQAAKYFTVEMDVIDKALSWLAKTQTADGAFPEVGTICHKDMQGEAGSGLALTAYTVVAFLENPELGKKYKERVDKALACITSQITKLDDLYTHALVAYVLQIADHPQKAEVFASLQSKAQRDGDTQWWSKAAPKQNLADCWYYRPSSVNVEMSAYGLLAMLESSAELEGLPIMKWLIAQRNDKGGFQSTQDTVVGLQALTKMAAALSSSAASMAVQVKLADGLEKKISVQDDNLLVLQKHELPAATSKIEMTATGKGCALFQLSYKYNIKDVDSSPRFILKPAAKVGSTPRTIDLSFSASFIPKEDQTVSNMAVMEVDMPSGYIVESDTLKQLKQHELVKKVETKRGDTTVVLYFDNIGVDTVSLQMSAFQKHEVENAKPANVIIYDYYDNTRCARSFYEVAA